MSTVLTSSATGATFCDGAAGSGDESGRKPRTMPIPRLRNQLATMPGPFAEVARTIAAPTGVVTRHRTHGACLTEPGEADRRLMRSEEHPSELQSLMRTSYADSCLKKKKRKTNHTTRTQEQRQDI